MKLALVAAGAALLCIPAPADAGESDQAPAWREITRADADAALQLIENNHPGARREVGDARFLARLAAAKAHVAERLPKVENYPGYAALMLGLANDFGDGHIWSSGLVSANRIGWSGLVAERRGGRWVVGHDLNPGGALTGAEVLSCDGRPAERLGRENIGMFRANPDVEAAMAGEAYLLFADDGNPFVQRPARCRFRLAGGSEVEQAIDWQVIATSQLQRQLGQVLQRPQAGLGVREFAGGYWIALETLSPDAEAVVAEVERLQDALRAAPMVVLDLRGNGGGNSAYTSTIAALLAGDDALAAIESGGEDTCAGAFWRASPGNAAAMRSLANAAEGDRGEWLGGIAGELEQANAAGQAFAPALPACASGVADAAPTVAAPPTLEMKGRLVLVTDRVCFSSCLIAADEFRRLGALHVGEATDRSTRYMEVREETLPSGLRTFSTLMKLALGAGDFGPYAPEVPYPGVLADDEALEAWVAALPQASRMRA